MTGHLRRRQNAASHRPAKPFRSVTDTRVLNSDQSDQESPSSPRPKQKATGYLPTPQSSHIRYPAITRSTGTSARISGRNFLANYTDDEDDFGFVNRNQVHFDHEVLGDSDYDYEEEDSVADSPPPTGRHLSSKLKPYPKPAVKRTKRQRRRVPWTDDQFKALEEALQVHGPQWALIMKDERFSHRLAGRTNVDLKDKARNERLARERRGLDPGIFAYACKYHSK